MGELRSYTVRLEAAKLERDRTNEALNRCPEWKAFYAAGNTLCDLQREAKEGYEAYMKQQGEKADAED